MATQAHTESGHCRILFTCQPSCPGALLVATSQLCHQSSSPVKAWGCQPVVARGGVTLSHWGP